MMSAYNIPQYSYASFSPSVFIFSWFDCFIPSIMYRLTLGIISIFLSQIPSQFLDYIFSLPPLGFEFFLIFWK